jgi:hypothetical protein
MTTSVTSPLQLTAAAGLLNNTGIGGLPADLTAALLAFNSLTPIQYLRTAIDNFAAKTYATDATAATLLALQSLGATNCPALGDSIPAAYTTLTPVVDPAGFTGLIEQTGNAYLGDGDIGKFAQGFMAVQGYLGTTNSFIESAVNANSYLGPFFTNMNDLVTNNIYSVNPDLENFGIDLARQGNLVDLSNLELYGTPAGLLQQISQQGKIRGDTLPLVKPALLATGLTDNNIADLVNDNRYGLLNPNGLTQNEFDQLQRLAYNAMVSVKDTALLQVLDILDVTTPNIASMADLLDPVKVFPLSYQSLQTPTINGPIPIYNGPESVSSAVAPAVEVNLPVNNACDALGKIIPQSTATANKAIQVSLQQIGNINNTTLPELAETILGNTPQTWDPVNEYLANSVVAVPGTTPTNYRAQQDVPPGTDITNTSYWLPATLGGLNTMCDLPLIEAQTTPVDTSVTSYFANSVATGSGANGTINNNDVLGTALGLTHTECLVSATATMQSLITAGALTALTATYNSMQTAASDAAMQGYIATATGQIATVVSSYPTQVASLNTCFNDMAARLSSEKAYQTQASIDYFNLQPGEKTSVLALVQNLNTYGPQTVAGGPNQFLSEIADTTTLTGQALVGSLRQAQNQVRLDTAGISTAALAIPSDAEITPPSAVNLVQC